MSLDVLGSRVQQGATRLKESRFARNVASVGMGIAAAQMISLLFTPLLTRLYGPEAFGVLGAYTAVVNIITPLATLGYANAVVMPEDEEQAFAVARLSFVSAVLVAPVALLFVHLFKPQIAQWTGLEAAPNFLYLIPLSLLLVAFFSVASQAAIREGLFKHKAQAYVGGTLAINGAKLAGGLLAPSGLLLIAVAVAGKAVYATLLLARVPKQGVLQIREWLGFRGIRQSAKEYRDFAAYRMPQSVIRATAMGLPVLLLTALFGAEAAGQYSITVLVLSAPVMLLGDSVGEVFYPKITRSIQTRGGDAHAVIAKATLALIVLGALPFGLVVLFGDEIFPFVFGDEWVRAGEYAQWIALWLAATLASRPSVAAIPVLRIQHLLLAYEIVITGARVAALYVGARVMGSDLAAIAVFSLVNVVGYLCLIVWSWVKAKSFNADSNA